MIYYGFHGTVMELFASEILPFFREVQGQNKTGTSWQGMLYVDNRGIIGLAGAGSV